jgi:hypothetical protein
MFLGYRFAPLQLIIFVPALSFFMTYFFLIIKREWLSEILFLLTWLIIIGLGYYSIHFLQNTKTQYLADKTLNNTTTNNKKILIFGDNFLPYYKNTVATPYFNWNLAQEHFSNLNKYNTTIEVYHNFCNELPEVIIDEHNFMPQLTSRIPLLGNLYEQKDKKVNIFTLKNKQ